MDSLEKDTRSPLRAQSHAFLRHPSPEQAHRNYGTEREVVVKVVNARVELDALDDVPHGKLLGNAIAVEFIEVVDTQCQVGFGEEIHRLDPHAIKTRHILIQLYRYC